MKPLDLIATTRNIERKSDFKKRSLLLTINTDSTQTPAYFGGIPF